MQRKTWNPQNTVRKDRKIIIRIDPTVTVDGIRMPAAEKGEMLAFLLWYGGKFTALCAVLWALTMASDWIFDLLW